MLRLCEASGVATGNAGNGGEFFERINYPPFAIATNICEEYGLTHGNSGQHQFLQAFRGPVRQPAGFFAFLYVLEQKKQIN
jgi:hypothetical protein